jgi:hypothetical protein
MDCCERSERARRMLEELRLILYWAEHFRDCLTTSDVEVQRRRRSEIMDGIIALRRQCEVAAPRSGDSLCPMAQFFTRLTECASFFWAVRGAAIVRAILRFVAASVSFDSSHSMCA